MKMDESKLSMNINMNINILNEKQKQAYDAAMEGKNIFITGPSGTGKSLVINLFRKNSIKNVAMTSTTGVSALLVGGTTIHSYLGIGFGKDSAENLARKILNTPYLRNRWKSINTLIIDEISMLSPELFDKLEIVARNVRFPRMTCDNLPPFGGIQLIITGDFLQLPVVGNDKFCFEAKSWNSCIDETFHLTEIMRQTDNEFQIALNELRFGIVSEDTKALLNSRLNATLKNDIGIKPTKIFTTNSEVDVLNETELDNLVVQNPELAFHEYLIDINIHEFGKNNATQVEKYKKSCIAPSVLQLCVGAQVMLLHNLDLAAGLANGSRGVVIDFVESKPVVRFLNGEERVIDEHIWQLEQDGKLLVTITQIPLKLAWAITCHKSQGCTLDYAEISLKNVFEYGMAYVALSRVTSLNGMSISDIDYSKIKAHPKSVEFYKNLT